MLKKLLLLALIFVPFYAFTQEVTPTPVPGEAQILGVSAWISAHMAWIIGAGGALLEIVLRVWPSNNIRSLFSYAGKILKALGGLLYLVSDLISKVLPDKPAETK